MLAYNHTLAQLGTQLSKLNSIIQQPTFISADIFHARSQAVMPKASPAAISLGGGLVVGGILDSIGINDNKILSWIPNDITSPSRLWYMVKKPRESIFMRIVGFVWNYPCRISCNKGESAGIIWMVKDVDVWDDERVQPIRLDADASNGSLEEVEKALDVSLIQIDN